MTLRYTFGPFYDTRLEAYSHSASWTFGITQDVAGDTTLDHGVHPSQAAITAVALIFFAI